MASVSDWKVPAAAQPAGDYGYDLESALAAVVGLRAIIPPDAFTAETLGTERAGNGVLIRGDGLILTIGYLITEAETIWLHADRRPHRAGPRARLRPGDRLRPGAGAGAARSAGAADRRFQRGGGRRARRGRRRRRPHALGRGAHRRAAGIRRLLGIRARRGDLHRAGASQLGRHRADRLGRRTDRHRLAAARAGASRARRASTST